MKKSTFSKLKKYSKLKKTDFLALERTKLANERTFLAYFRSFVVFMTSGVAILKIEWLEKIFHLGYVLIGIAIVLLIIGYFRLVYVKRKIRAFSLRDEDSNVN